jgi:hypothetical protein
VALKVGGVPDYWDHQLSHGCVEKSVSQEMLALDTTLEKYFFL